jgi:carbamoyl-phosphate synthase small subunit
MRAILALEDGATFVGHSFGVPGERTGEVVFNTGMTGYQEVLTDPSYRGQMVVMTYPHIGNYGVNAEDAEAARPYLAALLVREYCPQPSNWRTETGLGQFLWTHGVMALTGVDTRALTRHIRTRGAMKAIVSTEDLDPTSLVAKARAAPDITGRDLVREVTCTEPYEWTEGTPGGWNRMRHTTRRPFHVVVYDCGVKRNILRHLVDRGCRVTVVPASTLAAEVRALTPDGLLLSNGPGDPEGVPYLIESVREFLALWKQPGKGVPIFGICLGHQVLGLALGGRTYKLKFGHHGGNQPVKDLRTGRVQITTQNHNFAVDITSLDESEIELTHINLNDNTVEGMRHRGLPVFSVQYHPEAAPGPHDAEPLFGNFVELMEDAQA